MRVADTFRAARARVGFGALSGENYFFFLLLTAPLAAMSNFVHPGVPIFKGHPLAVLAPIASGSVAVLLWLRYRSTAAYQATVRMFLLGYASVWLMSFAFTIRDGLGWSFSALLVPSLLFMVFFKPVSKEVIVRSARWFAVSILAVVLLAEFWEFLVLDSWSFPGFRIPGLPTSLVPGARWDGPFLNPNYAGPITALVLVFALSQSGWFRTVIGSASGLFLLASGSRSALFGAFCGVAVLLVFADARPLSRVSRKTRAIGVGLGISVLLAISVSVDPSLNGRTPIWRQYWKAWLEQPFSGVGSPLLEDQGANVAAVSAYVHGHNEILDLLGRWGLLGAIPVLALLVLAALITARSAGIGDPRGLALFVVFFAIAVIEVHGSWIYISVPSAWLAIAVLMSAGLSQPNRGLENALPGSHSH